ncbi:MAG: PDZ domain-containing protein, partial [Desulfatibacillaceae bacterium]|nr:PDZ domain-containing protein [Desulfatibacillaceae bacterium]
AKRFVEKGVHIPVSRLWNQEDFRRAPRLVAYVQAGSFVRFLVEEFGLEKFKLLYARPDLKAVYGKSLLWLEEQWLLKVQGTELDEGARRIVDYRMSLAALYAHEKGLLNMPWAGFAVHEEAGEGVSINQVFDASPASRLGLRPHDRILAIDGRAVRPGMAWVIGEAIFEKRPGEAVAIAISRQGMIIAKRLFLGAKPMSTGLPQDAPAQPEGAGR